MNQMELEKLSGGMWNCVGKRKSPHRGHIYKFIIREEYDTLHPDPDLEVLSRIGSVSKKIKEMFPAVELTPNELWNLCDNQKILENRFATLVPRMAKIRHGSLAKKYLPAMRKELDMYQEFFKKELNWEWRVNQTRRDLFGQIGYRVLLDENNHLLLELPDKEALVNGWKHLQSVHPEMQLPPLDVLEADGIADDLAFADAYRDHDSLLSTGAEFVHDQTIHIMTCIDRMFRGKRSYEAGKKRIIGLINDVRNAMQEAIKREAPEGILHTEREKLNFMVGKITDFYFSPVEINSITKENVELLLSDLPYNHAWDDVLKKRFGEGTSYTTIANLWKEVKMLVPLKNVKNRSDQMHSLSKSSHSLPRQR